MSLLATASIWSNNENKKRVSSIRKQKKNQFISDDIEHMNNPSDEKPKVPSLEEMKTLGEERSFSCY